MSTPSCLKLIFYVILSLLSCRIRGDLQRQYAFAHRVNSKNDISYALASGANGIELDLCYDGNWIVSHYDFSNCNGDTLQDWLIELNNLFTSFPAYIDQLAMLWLDFKTPGNNNMDLVPNIVHSIQLPSTLKILYDLVDFDSNGQNGFQKIKNLLNSNEGISFCAGKSCGSTLTRVTDIYNYYKNQDFKRGTFNSGDSLSIDNTFLTEANSMKSNLADPYRFKLVLVWTTGSESQMNNYMNPTNSYQTDGQIIGPWWRGWQSSDSSYVTTFLNVISTYSTTQTLATGGYDPFDSIQVSTSIPTTAMPTTLSPTTSMPTTTMPTTLMPTTLIPTTSIPTTLMPTTNEPTESVTITTTSIPTTKIPTSLKPTTNEPTIDKMSTTLDMEATNVAVININNGVDDQLVINIAAVIIVSAVVLCICIIGIIALIFYCKLKGNDREDIVHTNIEMNETITFVEC